MIKTSKQGFLNFCTYPPIGQEDWRYAFACARVRALDTQFLSSNILHDLATAENFVQAVELLSSTPYNLGSSTGTLSMLEEILRQARTDVRQLFKKLVVDDDLVDLLLERDDFANLRLALRRKLTDKPIGKDYSNDGSIAAEKFEEIFEQEDYSPLPMHMREAIEDAVLAYYQNKDVRQIDLSLDNAQSQYKITKATEIGCEFLEGLFRLQVDLSNIKTMLRLKFRDSDNRDAFLSGGYLSLQLLRRGLDLDYDSISATFANTPYYSLIESSISYLTAEQSFLVTEKQCDAFIGGYLKSTTAITAGHQPVIAYLIKKESEIRNVRLILTAKKNNLDKKLILDRIPN